MTHPTFDQLRDQIPDFARDIRLNLGVILTPEGAPDLTQAQIAGIVLASAYTTKHQALIATAEQFASQYLDNTHIEAAKAATAIMGMNNIYYRFLSMVSDPEYATMPAKLRMNIIGNPGIAKADFEMYALAVSIINGCAKCVDSHVHAVAQHGISKLGIQSTIRIAAVIHAAAQSLTLASQTTLNSGSQAA